MTNLLLHIIPLVLCLTNMEIQVTSGDQSYATNYGGTNTVIGVHVPLNFAALGGDVGFLSWRPTTNRVYVQWSTNLADWEEIRVAHIDATYWYVKPEVPTFYRLRCELKP